MKHLYKQFEISRLVYREKPGRGPEGGKAEKTKAKPEDDETIILDDDDAPKKAINEGEKMFEALDPMRMRQEIIDAFNKIVLEAASKSVFGTQRGMLRRINQGLESDSNLKDLLNKFKSSEHFESLVSMHEEGLKTGQGAEKVKGDDVMYIGKVNKGGNTYSLFYSYESKKFEVSAIQEGGNDSDDLEAAREELKRMNEAEKRAAGSVEGNKNPIRERHEARPTGLKKIDHEEAKEELRRLEENTDVTSSMKLPQIDIEIPMGLTTDEDWYEFIGDSIAYVNEAFDQAISLARSTGNITPAEARRAERERRRTIRQIERLPKKLEQVARKAERQMARLQRKAERLGVREYKREMRKLAKPVTPEKERITRETTDRIASNLKAMIDKWSSEGVRYDDMSEKIQNEILHGSLSTELEKIYDLRSKLYVVEMKLAAAGYSYRIQTKKGAIAIRSMKNRTEEPDKYDPEVERI